MKMRTFRPIRKDVVETRGQRGSMLLEVLIAMVVLSIGLGGLIPLLVSSMYTNTNSSTDTTSTMVAEHVLEQITAQDANNTTSLTITDCAGTGWTIGTTGATQGSGNGGSNGGDGANLTSSGYVDWTQDYSSVPSGYAAKYVACGAGGAQRTYEVRWDVITTSTYTRMVVISARPIGETSGMHYVVPVNLRTIGGQIQ
jgi:type II secretory pathway pseudopilin PulG